MSGNTIVATSILTCKKWSHPAGTVRTYCLTEGAAYVFDQPAGGWSGTLSQNAVLTSSILTSRTAHSGTGLFGTAVAISGGTIAVGGVWRPLVATNTAAGVRVRTNRPGVVGSHDPRRRAGPLRPR